MSDSVEPRGKEESSRTIAIRGLDAVFTGIGEAPLRTGAVVVDRGIVSWLGPEDDCPATAQTIVAEGMTLAPGLFDTHCHVHLSDYTPRQDASGFLRAMLSGAVSQVISAGELHGLPTPDREGRLALAVLANRVWRAREVDMPRVRAGVLLFDSALRDEDFRNLAEQGVDLAKIGFGEYHDEDQLRRHVELAKRAGMIVMAHSGPPSLPGGHALSSSSLMALGPDVYAHVNGGPTSLSMEEIELLLSSPGVLQVVAAGNVKTAAQTITLAAQDGQLHRVVLGSETPSGAGVMPTAMLRLLAVLAALTDVPPEDLWPCGSGRAADVFGHSAGRIAQGAPADLCLLDTPQGSHHRDVRSTLSAGDCPSVQLMMLAGRVVRISRRNTPPGEHSLRILGSANS